jgi:hypothetical protein
MAADLAAWAAKRAPELVARAEAEAVEELKRALLEAAVTGRRPAEREAKRVTRRPVEGDGLWCYCVARAGERLPEDVPGVHPGEPVRAVERAEFVALASRVPLAEYGEEPLRENLNDFEWLERVARAHEGVLEAALKTATIVPLRLCTIFEDESGLTAMLEDQHSDLAQALDLLDGRQEWGVKLLVDRSVLEAAAGARSAEAGAVQASLESRSGGGAYMQRRPRERQNSEAADQLAAELTEDVHARLQDWASDAVVNSPQNRDLSGHEGEMLLNAAYLIETERVGRLRELVTELEERHRELGARLELSGPWPPYNFVPRRGTTLA